MNNSYIMNQFTQIISHFYRQIIKKHNNQTQLINKYNKLLHFVNSQELQTINTPTYSQSSPSYKHIKTSRQKTANEKATVSALQGGSQWSCQWYLVRPKLSKILVYVILHSLITGQNYWQFHSIKEEVFQKLKNINFGQNALFKISLQLQKITKLFFRSQHEYWQHILIEILKKVPKQVNNYILQKYSLFDVDNVDDNKLDEYLKQLTLKLKIKVHYYQLDCKRIIVNRRYGISEIQYNFGYVGSMDKYTLANRFPVLSEERAKKMQDLQRFQMNIAELIKECEENSVQLNQIQSLQNYVSAENTIKEFIKVKK